MCSVVMRQGYGEGCVRRCVSRRLRRLTTSPQLPLDLAVHLRAGRAPGRASCRLATGASGTAMEWRAGRAGVLRVTAGRVRALADARQCSSDTQLG